jgi:signal transduction histidine kinase
VELLLSEILGNAIRHTSSDHIKMSLSYAAGLIRLEVVVDGAPGRPRMRHPGPDEESGRGLLIVNALAEQWGTSQDGSTTWCTIAVRNEGRLDWVQFVSSEGVSTDM